MRPFLPHNLSVSFLPLGHSFGMTCDLQSPDHALPQRHDCIRRAGLLLNLQEVWPMVLSMRSRAVRPHPRRGPSDDPRDPRRHRPQSRPAVGRESDRRRAVAIAAAVSEAAASCAGLDWYEHCAAPRGSIRLHISLSRHEHCSGGVFLSASEGAKCVEEALGFFDSVGVMICEEYGLTETAPARCAECAEPCLASVGDVWGAHGGVDLRLLRTIVGQ